MRTWRVGTFSMGLSIISLGAFTIFSRKRNSSIRYTNCMVASFTYHTWLKFYYTFYFLRRNNHLLNMIFLVFSLSVF